ncbi:MAG: glucoamylase family protein [Pseudomonadota bacterium]|nr:glucoamylase family protein [Pseudomonadota bacterium]
MQAKLRGYNSTTHKVIGMKGLRWPSACTAAMLALLSLSIGLSEVTARAITASKVAASEVAPRASRAQQLPSLFADIERRTFNYFWERSDERNGLTSDRFPYDEPFASIAAMGFALTSYPLGAERGWITRDQARVRTLATLRFLHDAPQGSDALGMSGHHGFFYHFLHLDTGHRYASWVELSSVDTALLLGGVLFAQTWFDQDRPDEREIVRLAEAIFLRVDWTFLQARPPLISHGWYPENGLIEHDWAGYSEGMLVYILALASPTHPVAPEAWTAWTQTYERSWAEFYGQEHLGFGPLFGHQFSHVWIDFRDIQDAYMREKHMDYFENSRRATLAQRAYAVSNPGKFKAYGRYQWGLTASDGPGDFPNLPSHNGRRSFRGYSARGAGVKDQFDDGTIAPTAMLGSLPFAPELVIPSVRDLHRRYAKQIYGEYGFFDAFNRSFDYDLPLRFGRRIPGWGWVDDQYIGIDQGPILTMISNHRNGRVWEVMRRNPHIRRGLQRAGFTGGWLDRPVQPLTPVSRFH